MADLSDLLKNFSSMVDENQIPDNLKEFISSMQSNTSNEQNTNSNNNSNASSNSPNIDINTLLKMQAIINTINNSADNSGANLLRSLKPYLNPNRQEKVDEYIQLFNLEKVLQILKKSGGENGSDG